jgi:TolA-binding protein
MKNLSPVLLLLAIAGCAGTPPASDAPTPQQQAASAVDVTDPKKIDTDTIMAAQESGQTIVQENGEEMVCKRQKQTGSHLHQKTICMTKEDWEKTTSASKQTLEDMARQRPPRQGN